MSDKLKDNKMIISKRKNNHRGHDLSKLDGDSFQTILKASTTFSIAKLISDMVNL
jgi:hypothetical protein